MKSLSRFALMLLALAGLSLSAIAPAQAGVTDPQACFAASTEEETKKPEEGAEGTQGEEAEEDPDCE